MIKKIIAISIAILILLSTTIFAINIEFIDVEDHWAKSEIYRMANKWIILGKGDGTFGPNEDIIKSHAFLMFSRLMGYYDKDNEEIIKQATEEYAEILKNAGITQAISELSFLIKTEIIDESYIMDVLGNGKEMDELTRVEASIIFVKLLGDESYLNRYPLLVFDDDNLVDEKDKAYVEYVNKIGLMVGYDNYFNPNGYVTRAQLATILCRIENIIIERNSSKQIGTIEEVYDNQILVNVNNSIRDFMLDENVEIYKDDKLIKLSSLQFNDRVVIYLGKNNLIEKITVDNKLETVYGKFINVVDNYISIEQNKAILKYELISKDLKILKDNSKYDINNIKSNDDLKLVIENDKVIEIGIGEINYNISGSIDKIVIGRKSYITIKDLNEEYKEFITTKDMICDFDGAEGSIYDLRLDMDVKLTITNEGIKKVKVETLTNIEIITGKVQRILPKIYVFTIELEENQIMMMFLDEEETVIKTTNGIAKGIDDLKEGNLVSVYGRYEGDVFYPLQVLLYED